MKKIISLFLTLIILITVLPSCHDESTDKTRITKAPASPSDKVEAESGDYGSIESFSEKLSLKLLENSTNDNIVFSPLSAYLALAMVKEGADGETLKEMTAVMGDLSAEDVYILISHLTTLENTQLNIANSVWIDTASNINPRREYLDNLSDYYLAECYKTLLCAAENEVNAWISEHTNGMIEKMLDETALDECVMSLVNTIYINANWENKFDASNTRKRNFTNSDGSTSEIDFMHNSVRNELVIESDAYIGVTLPYEDTSLRFVAVMPTNEASDTKAALEAVYADGGWKSIAENAEHEKIRLYLPSFEYNSSLSLRETLSALGIKTAFTAGADFSGIDEGLMLDSVLQNAAIKLHENGTEASAATVVTVKVTGALLPAEKVRTIEFNRPFVFAVVDTVSGAVLFAGEYNTAD